MQGNTQDSCSQETGELNSSGLWLFRNMGWGLFPGGDECTLPGNTQVSLQKGVPPSTHFSSKSKYQAEPKHWILPDLVH